MHVSIADEWSRHFVAYEDALASFYSLQDETQRALDESRAIRCGLDGLARLREPILEASRRLRSSADGGRVAEIDRERATLHIDGARFDVRDLVANRMPAPDALLELSFRVDPKSILRFVNLTGTVRISFPFAGSTYVAACRLVKFKLVRHEFAFSFATVDPS
jgi:hypothetical protein